MLKIYGKKRCLFSYRAKQLCKREKLSFTYKQLGKDFTKAEFLEKFPGAKTFPQIIMNGEKIGGYAELVDKLGVTPNNAAIGVAVFAATNEPVWIAVGVAIGAALSWQKP